MKVSWLKLEIDILNDTKIKVIRKYPDGNSLFVLWVGLLCLSMKSDNSGYVYITQGIPFTPSDLASEFDLEEKTVEMGLKLFRKLNMIDYTSDGIIEVINFNKHQDIEKIEKSREENRIRQQNYRIKQRNALLTQTSQPDNDTKKNREDKIRLEEKREEGEALSRTPSKKFKAPSIDEIYEQMVKVGIVDAAEESKKFFNYYESCGWKVGNKPMAKWAAAVNTWKGNIGKFKTSASTGSSYLEAEAEAVEIFNKLYEIKGLSSSLLCEKIIVQQTLENMGGWENFCRSSYHDREKLFKNFSKHYCNIFNKSISAKHKILESFYHGEVVYFGDREACVEIHEKIKTGGLT